MAPAPPNRADFREPAKARTWRRVRLGRCCPAPRMAARRKEPAPALLALACRWSSPAGVERRPGEPPQGGGGIGAGAPRPARAGSIQPPPPWERIEREGAWIRPLGSGPPPCPAPPATPAPRAVQQRQEAPRAPGEGASAPAEVARRQGAAAAEAARRQVAACGAGGWR
ncbi:hypothetical protein C2845_PM07G19410 [Panicum miliaceum]|uniref:Uncharacterized protein n=1 Tax=Panicum miliaceum TaxID=4540 RepID=A0A3L6SQL3_PANMI|nr:hypothetical protein C2845_PM07G19410 [Panicum miliaceum]